jgi:hypothetical protein
VIAGGSIAASSTDGNCMIGIPFSSTPPVNNTYNVGESSGSNTPSCVLSIAFSK